VNKEDFLQKEVQNFIRQHETDDENALLLKHKFILGIPASLVADQITGRRKAKLKLPSWYDAQNVIYPPSINIEQCSSEATARFKIELLRQNKLDNFNKVIDLTGGFGVDSFFFSSIFKEVDYVEPNENLLGLTRHNLAILQGAKSKKQETRVRFHNSTAENFLISKKGKYDLIFIDPSRRGKGNQKIFLFADCQPNVIELLPQIFSLTNGLLVKASPLIDLQSGIKELQGVRRIFVVAVDNDCKEVLFLCRKDFAGEPEISAVNLKSSYGLDPHDSFDFCLSEEKRSVSSFSDPLSYLYEPNSVLLKSGAFKLIGNRYQLQKLQQHTHLYTSDRLVENFPGRIFIIESIIKSDPKVVRHYFPEGKANVITRNYPLTVEQLKKKVGLKDGGEKFLIGFSGQSEKFTVVCSRVA
jgi:hypothetical protein